VRIVKHELRKIWNGRILLIIALLCVGFWFGGLREGVRSFDSLTRHGIFGAYQGLMFELFGETLESHELAAFDLPGRIAAVENELDAIIAKTPVFAVWGITHFAQYDTWRNSENFWLDLGATQIDGTVFFTDEAIETHEAMLQALQGHDGTLEGWFATPYMRRGHLLALEWRYANYNIWLESMIAHDSRPMVVQSAERILAMGNNSLIDNDLTRYFSLYSAVVGVLAVVAVAVLITPLIVVDRGRKVNYLQYSSKIGRKILRAQFAAIVLSAFVLSIAIIALAFIPFLMLSWRYWNASILSSCINRLWLYDITFGQYVVVAAILIIVLAVATAGAIFIASRFSQEILAAMFKIVPVTAALIGIAIVSLDQMFSAQNSVFTHFFRGQIIAPEIIVCIAISIICVVVAGIFAWRERRAELQ